MNARATNKVLLTAGIAAVVVYVIGDLLSGFLYHGYSYRDQAISELSAFGSPVRPLMVTVILIHGVLVIAFGIGVLRASGRRSLSWVGGLLIAGGVVGFPNHTVWAMSSRGMEGGFNDTMHIILSAVFSVLVVAAMALSAVAYPGWFRLYALATIAVVVGFGMASAFAIQGIGQNDHRINRRRHARALLLGVIPNLLLLPGLALLLLASAIKLWRH